VAQSTRSDDVDLRQYEGHYAYRDDLTLYLVAHRDRLVAVLGDGKYRLRRVAPDTFEKRGPRFATSSSHAPASRPTDMPHRPSSTTAFR
jgi:hypothetical protein